MIMHLQQEVSPTLSSHGFSNIFSISSRLKPCVHRGTLIRYSYTCTIYTLTFVSGSRNKKKRAAAKSIKLIMYREPDELMEARIEEKA